MSEVSGSKKKPSVNLRNYLKPRIKYLAIPNRVQPKMDPRIAKQIKNKLSRDRNGGVDFGGGGASFLPTDLPDLHLWLDAADTSTISLGVGSGVAQWDDKSGNGNHVVQSTASNQPITGSQTINSLNVIDWDGSNHVLESAGDFTALDNASSFSIFLVIEPDSVATTRDIISRWTIGNIQNNFVIRQNSAGLKTFLANALTDGGTHSQTTTDLTIVQDTPILLQVDWDGGEAADDDKIDMYANNTLKTDSVSGASWPSTLTNSNQPLRIGQLSPGVSFYDGSIGEMVISSKVNQTQQQQMTSYLNTKWGIF